MSKVHELETTRYEDVKASLGRFKKAYAENLKGVKFDPKIVRDDYPEIYSLVKDSIKFLQKSKGEKGWPEYTAINFRATLEQILFSEANYKKFLEAKIELDDDVEPGLVWAKIVDFLTFQKEGFLKAIYPDYRINFNAKKVSPKFDYTIDFESLKKTTKKVKVIKDKKETIEPVVVSYYPLKGKIQIKEAKGDKGYSTFSDAKKDLVDHFIKLRDDAKSDSMIEGFKKDIKTARAIKKADVITLEMQAEAKKTLLG